MMAAGSLSFPVLAALSVALLLLHVLIQANLSTLDRGLGWNAGPRDKPREAKSVLAGRAERMSANFRETYPGFVALVLALAIAGDPSGWGFAGALLWFAARIVYIPLYLGGVPYIRSLAWGVALIGLVMMFIGVLRTAG